MKKTLVALSVLAAAICCTLAFAVTRQGSLPRLLSLDRSTTEPSVKHERHMSDQDMRINPASVAMAKSIMEEKSRLGISEENARRINSDTSSDSQGEVTNTVDLWSATSNVTGSSNATIDLAERQVHFTTDGAKQAIFASVGEDGDFAWRTVPQTTYVFCGHIAAPDIATIYPCIVYVDEETGAYNVWSNSRVELNGDNGFASDFYVSAEFPISGTKLILGFIVEDNSNAQEFTSTNTEFYYMISGRNAEKWTAETDLEGLGIDEEMAENAYVVRCEDGVTSIGVYNDYGTAYITGINTSATEVTIPHYAVIDGEFVSLDIFGSLGVSSLWSWSGAPSLTRLNLGSVNQIIADFNGSALTDVYIGNDCTFDGSGFSGIYLHIPETMDRNRYTGYGFKRVLVGEETPDYPESDISSWVIQGENQGDYFGIVRQNGVFAVSEIFTNNESVIVPVATPYNNRHYYIRTFGCDNYYSNGAICAHAQNLKSVTVPDGVQTVNVRWNYNPIKELHMQGDVPTTYWSLPGSMTVYVGNQRYFGNYEDNSSWNSASIQPDGWEFEWMTVDVKRKGEFAQTYIEMTDADWSLGLNVKVTGTLNATDLGNMKKLTNIRMLDLSEAEFESLPESFMKDKTSLIQVSLPGHVLRIPSNAFNSCQNLTTVTAPGVQSVEEYAFRNCGKLENFDIANITNIGNYAFYNCLQYNPTGFSGNLAYIGSNAFSNTAITEAVLPVGVTSLNSEVFSGCSLLTRVVLPSTIRTIGNSSFYGCGKLSEVNLPEGVTTIRSSAFYNCGSLAELTIPSTVKEIGNGAFENCTKLVTVKCKAIVPPAASSSFTSGVDLNHCTLYIVPFAIDAYRAAKNWSNFYIMKPLNEPVKNIYINRPMTIDLQSEDNAVLQENPNITLDYENNNTVGQLSASGDGTLSAGVFKIFHRFECRDNYKSYDYRTTLVNNTENMRADSVICSIQFEKNYWHFISFQYDVRMEDIFGLNGTDFVIRQYNSAKRAAGDGTTDNWEDVPADGTLVAGKGYIIQAANNAQNESGSTYAAIVRFPSRNTTTKNNLFTSNNVIVPLDEYAAEFAHNRSWNLVGNPYPCYYDMHYLMDDFTTPVTLWRGSSYQAYSPVDDDIILRPNEAFFVQRPLDAEQITFGVEGRMHYDAVVNPNVTSGTQYAPADVSATAGRSVFNFTVDGCGSNDRARIVLNEEASMDYEIERDASKFFAETAVGAEIYVDCNVRYSICERPFDNGEALLGLRLVKDGEYTISLDGRDFEGWNVMLTDNVTGMTVNISETAYTFQGLAGNHEGRFTVRFNAPSESGVKDVTNDEYDDEVQVVNAAGIVVFSGDINDFKATAQPGVYVVVSKETTVKIVVK